MFNHFNLSFGSTNITCFGEEHEEKDKALNCSVNSTILRLEFNLSALKRNHLKIFALHANSLPQPQFSIKLNPIKSHLI